MEKDVAEFWTLVDAEVMALPDKYRVVFILYYLQGLTLDQASRQLGCPLGTAGTRLAQARKLLRSRLARRGLVVLISDLLFDRELALAALRYLRHRGHQVIVFHLMDPAEVNLAGPPEVRFTDPESPASVVVRPKELARAYADTVQREVAAWRTACRRHGIAYHHVQTDLPFGMALRLLT